MGGAFGITFNSSPSPRSQRCFHTVFLKASIAHLKTMMFLSLIFCVECGASTDTVCVCVFWRLGVPAPLLRPPLSKCFYWKSILAFVWPVFMGLLLGSLFVSMDQSVYSSANTILDYCSSVRIVSFTTEYSDASHSFFRIVLGIVELVPFHINLT